MAEVVFSLVMVVIILAVLSFAVGRHEDKLPPKEETQTKAERDEYWNVEDLAKEMPIAEFNEIFESGKTIIENETYGHTTDWLVWVESDAKYFVPKGAQPCFELVRSVKSFATREAFMYDGKVFPMDVKEPKMFSSVDEMVEEAQKMFAVFVAYTHVSPIDRETKRYFLVGCMKEDGVVPTHGL